MPISFYTQIDDLQTRVDGNSTAVSVHHLNAEMPDADYAFSIRGILGLDYTDNFTSRAFNPVEQNYDALKHGLLKYFTDRQHFPFHIHETAQADGSVSVGVVLLSDKDIAAFKKEWGDVFTENRVAVLDNMQATHLRRLMGFVPTDMRLQHWFAYAANNLKIEPVEKRAFAEGLVRKVNAALRHG